MVIFAQPERLWLLLAVAGIAALVLVRHRSRLENQRTLASPAVWDRLIGGAPATGVWRMMLWCAAAAFIVLALARPQWGTMPDEVSIGPPLKIMVTATCGTCGCFVSKRAHTGRGVTCGPGAGRSDRFTRADRPDGQARGPSQLGRARY